MNNLGKQGESIAKEYLENNGYKVLKTNYTTKLGEIDIVAKQDEVIVFVEVKSRSNTKFGLPRESVTPYKQNKIRTVAMAYLKQFNLLNRSVRFDVIEILDFNVEHIIDAF